MPRNRSEKIPPKLARKISVVREFVKLMGTAEIVAAEAGRHVLPHFPVDLLPDLWQDICPLSRDLPAVIEDNCYTWNEMLAKAKKWLLEHDPETRQSQQPKVQSTLIVKII